MDLACTRLCVYLALKGGPDLREAETLVHRVEPRKYNFAVLTELPVFSKPLFPKIANYGRSARAANTLPKEISIASVYGLELD